jgi:hypothetical protein
MIAGRHGARQASDRRGAADRAGASGQGRSNAGVAAGTGVYRDRRPAAPRTTPTAPDRT